MTILLVFILTVSSFLCLFQLATGKGALGSHLYLSRSSVFRLPALAICLHWCIYNSALNFPILFVRSDHINMYSWVVSHQFLDIAASYTLCFYVFAIGTLEIVARTAARIKVGYEAAFHQKISIYQPLIIALIVLMISMFVGGTIGTTDGDGGAWADTFPAVLRPVVRGVFVIQFAPSILVLIRCFQREKASCAPRRVVSIEFLILMIQIISFIMLRQRFIAFAGLAALLVYGMRIYRKRLVFTLGLVVSLIVYAVPTALRYTRLAKTESQSQWEYLSQSYNNFMIGLNPDKLINSFVNDISYNKAGLAPLSIVLDNMEAGNTGFGSWIGWIRPEIYSSLPVTARDWLRDWAGYSAEELVSKALGVGAPGWSSPGVSSEVSHGWVIDLVDTPLLNAAVSGGFPALIICAIFSGIFIGVAWIFILTAQVKINSLWVASCSYLGTIALYGSWIGGLIVATKVGIMYAIMCSCVSAVIKKTEQISPSRG